MNSTIRTILIILFVFFISALIGKCDPIQIWHTNPGFKTIVITPTFQSYQVKSWTIQQNKVAAGYIKNQQVQASYKASFSGGNGHATGSSKVIRTGNSITVTSTASSKVVVNK